MKYSEFEKLLIEWVCRMFDANLSVNDELTPENIEIILVHLNGCKPGKKTEFKFSKG